MTQILKKYIGDDQVDNTKILLNNNGTLRAKSADGLSVVDILKVTTADLVELQNLVEVNSALPIPFKPKHVATIEYITNYLAGKTDAKDALNAISATNLALTGSTPLVVDGVTMLDGYRLGLTDQSTGSERGFYDVSITGGTYTLTRTTDFDQVSDAGGLEVTTGAWAKVIAGTVYGGWEVQLTTTGTIVIGTTSLTFVKYPSVLALTGGDMIAKNGNDFSVDLASLGGLESTNPGNSAGQLRIKADQNAALKDKTTRLDPTDGSLVTARHRRYEKVLNATDITNQYVDLSFVAQTDTITFVPGGAPMQHEGVDFNVNYTGGVGSNTRITFAGQLASAGASPLASGETVYVKFRAF